MTAAPEGPVSRKPLIPALACLLLATACSPGSLLGPAVPLDRQFTLAPGQTALVQGTALRVAFVRVSGDSRCPADAFCVQGGDAIVHVRATAGTAADHELHTGNQAEAVALHEGFRIELTQLQPYPFSSRTIAPGEYRATLVVTR